MNCHARGLGIACVVLLFGAQAAQAQHQGDVWIGRSADGQLKVDARGYIPEDNYHTLNAVNGPLFWGWSDNSPGFDRIVQDDPQNDIYAMEPGAAIWLEIVAIDAPLRLIDGAFKILDTPGEETFLGGHTLHVHHTWHVDSTSQAYDPDQCVWEATFVLHDEGSTGYTSSEPFTFHGFTNVLLQDLDGDFDDDLDVDTDDFAAFASCMDGSGSIPNPDDPTITTCEVECINAFDGDDDRDVDVEDFAEFQVYFTGN